MCVPGGIAPLQTFDMCHRPIHILKEGFPTNEQIGIDCKGEGSPILIVRITGQTSSRKRVCKELDNQSESRTFGATIESHQGAGHENFLRSLGWDACGVINHVWGQCLAFEESLCNLKNRHRRGRHVQDHRFAAGRIPIPTGLLPKARSQLPFGATILLEPQKTVAMKPSPRDFFRVVPGWPGAWRRTVMNADDGQNRWFSLCSAASLRPSRAAGVNLDAG